MTARLPDPDRACDGCGGPLVRQRYASRLESAARFAQRRYCSRECYRRSAGGPGVPAALNPVWIIPPQPNQPRPSRGVKRGLEPRTLSEGPGSRVLSHSTRSVTLPSLPGPYPGPRARSDESETPVKDPGIDPNLSNWRRRAACRGSNPRLWTLERGEPAGMNSRPECGSCPVAEQCAAAIRAFQVHGLWAGEAPVRAR